MKLFIKCKPKILTTIFEIIFFYTIFSDVNFILKKWRDNGRFDCENC